jgi:asparagine synthase (glutamine-hydrolysing)
LDHKLVEFIFNLDFELLYKNKELKHLLKKLAIDFIPERNVYRTKKGFSAPVMKWLKIDLHNEIVNGQMVKDGFINKIELVEFLKKEKNLGKIWQLFIFEKWYSTHYKS